MATLPSRSEPTFGCATGRGSEAVTGHGAQPNPHRVIIAQLQCMLALGQANPATPFYKNLAIAGRFFDVMVYGEPEGQTWSILTAISPGTN